VLPSFACVWIFLMREGSDETGIHDRKRHQRVIAWQAHDAVLLSAV
jgi:hypothetical protein